MKHTQTYWHSYSSPYKESERRLCFLETGGENLREARTAMDAKEQMASNPHIMEATKIYADIVRVKFADQIKTPVERSFFFTLLMNNMLKNAQIESQDGGATVPARKTYGTIARSEMNVHNPFGIDSTIQGFEQTKQAWMRQPDRSIQENIIAENVTKYLQTKDALDKMLREGNIAIPDMQSVENPNASERLSRDEYFDLMVLMVSAEQPRVQSALNKYPADALKGIREIMSTTPVRELTVRANKIRTDMLVDQLGPTETLNRFGVVLGPYLRHDYLESRRDPKATVNAALWEKDPKLAHDFLIHTQFPNLPGNAKFLKALEYYFVDTPSKNPADAQGMSEKDVRSILSLVVQSLITSDMYLTRSAETRTKLKETVNTGGSIEKMGAGIWEYMKDFREHPVGSFAVGIASFVAVKKLWNMMTSEHSNLANYIAYAGLGSFAVGMYQQSKGDTPFYKNMWDKLRGKVDKAQEKELNLDPKTRGLADYWAKECKFDDIQQRDCLSILEEQPTDKVLEWYRSMDVAKRNGRTTGADLRLPFSVAKYKNIFGDKPNNQIGESFYQALHKFFEHRGRAMRAGGWPLQQRNGVDDDASVGEEYIRSMFVERKYFHYMAMQMVKPIEASISGSPILIDGRPADIMKDWDHPQVQARLKAMMPPDMYFKLGVFRYVYVQEENVQDTASWPMHYVFALQLDEGMASRMGEGTNETRSVLETVSDYLQNGNAAIASWWNGGSPNRAAPVPGPNAAAPGSTPNPSFDVAPAGSVNVTPNGAFNVLPNGSVDFMPGRSFSIAPNGSLNCMPNAATTLIPNAPFTIEAAAATTIVVAGRSMNVAPGSPLSVPPNSAVTLPAGNALTLRAPAGLTLEAARSLSIVPSAPTTLEAGKPYVITPNSNASLQSNIALSFKPDAPMILKPGADTSVTINGAVKALKAGEAVTINPADTVKISPNTRFDVAPLRATDAVSFKPVP